MITEQDLLQAIAECHAVKDPNANTCIKLAAYYTILDQIRTNPPLGQINNKYSYASGNSETVVYNGKSDFANKIQGMNVSDVLSVMDELMDTLSILHPNLYDSVMRKL